MTEPRQLLLAFLAEQGGRPFTAGQARRAGISGQQLLTAVRRGRISRLRRGVYCAGPTDQRSRIVAAAMKWPGAVVSHESAAYLLGLATWRQTRRVTLTHPDYDRSSPDLRVVQRRLPPQHVQQIDGVACTTKHRTAMDLAATVPLPQALITVDEAVRPPGMPRAQRIRPEVRRAARESLLRVAATMTGLSGVATARRAAGMSDPAADSPPESMGRGLLYLWGFPQPLVGRRVVGIDGDVYFVDMLWPDHRLAGEVDGRLKYRRKADLWAEKDREDQIRARGLDFARLPASSILASSPTVANRLVRKGLPHGPAYRDLWR